ncbi:hypothetical protein ACSQ67_008844 [Phaseolus vulgaris]
MIDNHHPPLKRSISVGVTIPVSIGLYINPPTDVFRPVPRIIAVLPPVETTSSSSNDPLTSLSPVSPRCGLFRGLQSRNRANPSPTPPKPSNTMLLLPMMATPMASVEATGVGGFRSKCGYQ